MKISAPEIIERNRYWVRYDPTGKILRLPAVVCVSVTHKEISGIIFISGGKISN